MVSTVDVRLAVPGDAEAIANILAEAFGEYRENYTPEAFKVVTPPASSR